MAQMIPYAGRIEEHGNPAAGELLPFLRQQLGDGYAVIQNPAWFTVDDDGCLRTGSADFLLIHPRHGILVLSVRGGQVAYDGGGQRWTTTDAHGARQRISNPFAQARVAAEILERTVRRSAATDPHAWSYWVDYAVWFPAMRWSRAGDGVLSADELVRALDEGDLEQPDEALLALHRATARNTPPPPLDDEAIAALVALVAPSAAVKSSLACDIAGEESHIRDLTNAQRDRLFAMWYARRRLAVPGAAGTGKTVLALEMAWRLAEQGLDVLFLCANQVLADWLRARVAEDYRPGKPRFTIHSVRSLVAHIARLGGFDALDVAALRMDFSAHQQQLAAHLARNVKAVEERGADMPYDAILVDEAQDIEHALWAPIQRLLRDRENGFFYVFYDEAQRVDFEEKWRPGFSGADICFPLTVNCRNTRAIYEAMARLNAELAELPFTGPEGRPIAFIDPAGSGAGDEHDREWGDDAETRALRAALDHLTGPAGGLRPEEILVISCRGEASTRWRLRHERVIGRHELRWVRYERAGYVSLATIRSAKGLEYKAVVLTELDGLADEKRRDALLYVAISRAMHHLVVLGTPDVIAPRRPSKVSAALAGLFRARR